MHEVDTVALREALDTAMDGRGLTLRGAAAEIGVSIATLSRVGNGKGLDADSYTSILAWLGYPAPFSRKVK